jgi:hypothetical protein
MIQKVDGSASGHLQNQELCSVIQAKLDGKSPYFYANQKHYKTKRERIAYMRVCDSRTV